MISEIEYITCPKCGETKPNGHFNKWKRQCKECRAAVQRDYVARNRETVNERGRKWQSADRNRKAVHLRKTYGISLEEYDQLHQNQGGVCAICKNECPSGRNLAVDHDHATGVVRGLLCIRCNPGLGWFMDDPSWLRAAADYLERERA